MKYSQYFTLGFGVIVFSWIFVAFSVFAVVDLKLGVTEAIVLFALATIIMVVGFIITLLPRRRRPFHM